MKNAIELVLVILAFALVVFLMGPVLIGIFRDALDAWAAALGPRTYY